MLESKEILFTHEQILQRAKEIGEEITRDYEGKEVILVGILRGSVPWMADVMKEIKLESVLIDFMACSSYGSGTVSSGQVKIEKDITFDVTDKNIIIVEDIVDSGRTLKYLKEYFDHRNAKSVKICSLLNKQARRVVDIQADYLGFEVEDRFIVGYGLDYDQKYRNLPYITCLD